MLSGTAGKEVCRWSGRAADGWEGREEEDVVGGGRRSAVRRNGETVLSSLRVWSTGESSGGWRNREWVGRSMVKEMNRYRFKKDG